MRFRFNYRFPYTADVYDYTIDTNSANGDPIYTYSHSVKVEFGDDPSAPRVVIVAEKPLRKRIVVMNVRDRNGLEVLPGAQFSITSVAPVLSVFGTREGYRMQAALNNDPDFSEV